MKKLYLIFTVLLLTTNIWAQVSEVKEDGIGFNYKLNQTEHSCAFCKKKYTTSEIDLISNISFDKNLGSLKQIRDAVAYTMTLKLWNITAGWTAMVKEECPSLDNKSPKHQWRNEQVSLSAKNTTSIKKGDDYRKSIENLYKGSYGFINKGMVDIILNRVLDKIDQNEPFKNLVYEEQKQAPSSSGTSIQGSQWTSKNLDIGTYRNGDIIPEVRDKKEWENLTTGAWCYYDNDSSNGTKYGKLYNWYAIHDPRGLAPNGFHIPSDAEWTQLIDYLGGDRGAGSKMKSSSGWPKDGNGTNSSGFSALPGGYRFANGAFNLVNYYAYWWTSTEPISVAYPISYQAWFRNLYWPADGSFSRDILPKRCGFSVRCIKD